MRAELIVSAAGFKELEATWDHVIAGDPDARLFQTFGWQDAVHMRKNESFEYFIVLVRDDVEVHGIFPCRVITRNLRFRKLKVLQFLSHNRGDYGGAVIGGDKAAAVSCFLEFLETVPQLWDMVLLQNVPEGDAFLGAWRHRVEGCGWGTAEFPGITAPFVMTDGEAGAYFSSVDKKVRKDVERCRRRLAEQGEMVIDVVDDPEASAGDFVRMHIKRWEGSGTPSRFVQAAEVDTLRAIIGRMAYDGHLFFHRLAVNGRPVAYHLDFRYGGRVYFYMPVHDPEYNRFAPGKILLEHIIRGCFEDNALIFDFLAGAEAYKSSWTARTAKTVNLLLFRDRGSRLVYDLFFNPDRFGLLQPLKKGM